MVAMCCGSLFLAGDGSPREGNLLLSELSVDVRDQWRRKAKGDAQRPFEMVVQGGLSLSVVQKPRVSANITVRDLDLGATVDDVFGGLKQLQID